MKIEVLGVGCRRCHTLFQQVQEATAALGIEAELTQITDLEELLRRGILATPTLMVDGAVVLSGRSAGAKELEKLLRGTLGKTPAG